MTSLFDNFDTSDSEDDSDYKPSECDIGTDDEVNFSSSDEEQEVKKTGNSNRKAKKSELDPKQNETKVTQSSETAVNEKKKGDDIYKSFLDEVAAEMGDSKTESVSSDVSCYGSTTSSPVVLNKEKNSQSSTSSTANELFEFAGETISVMDGKVKSVDSDISNSSHSEMAKQEPATSDSPDISPAMKPKPSVAAAAAVTQPVVKRKGLESVLGVLQNKKQKLTVMQKSILDWKSFKKDESLQEELEQFNRGKGGFIERQRFLQRSDLRSYEIERDMRMSKRPTQTKRDK